MSSAIINGLSKLWNGILKIIYDSHSYKIFSAVSSFFKDVVRKSFVLGNLMKPIEYEEKTDKGYFPKIHTGPLKKLGALFTKGGLSFGRMLKASFILREVYDFYFNILFQSLRTFGIIGAVSSLSYFIFTLIPGRPGLISFLVPAVILIISLVLMLSRTPLYDVLDGSSVVKFICGKFGNLNRLNLYDNRKRKNYYIPAIIIGIIIGVLPVLLPTIYAIAGIAAVFAVPIILIWPVMGLIALALAIAFIPTMLAAGLIVLTWLGVILNASAGKLKSKNILRIAKAPFVFGIIILFGGIISFAVAESIPIALIYIVFISVVFQFVIIVKDKIAFKTILLAAVAAALGTALIGIYQYLSGNIEVGWIDSEMFEGMIRIYSTFENPNVYGEYLLFMIPLSLMLFFSSKRIVYKLFWMGAGFLMVAAMMLTMSRGCWIGLAAGVFIYFAIADRRFLWLFLGAVVVLPFVLPESIMTRLLSIGNLEDSSSLYRLYIWLGTLSMLRDYWLTGVGLGTKAFSGIYSAYAYNGIPAPHPHNLYLNIISETGITGLLGFAWVAVTGVRNSISSALGKTGFTRHMGAALAASFTGFFIQGIFDNVFYNYRMVLVFWIFIAISYSYALITKREKAVADD